MDWIVRTQMEDYAMETSLILARSMPDGSRRLQVPRFVMLADYERVGREHAFITDTTRDGSEVHQFLQAAMDEAYRIGLRPSSARDDTHIERHLQDMRLLAFHGLGVPKEDL